MAQRRRGRRPRVRTNHTDNHPPVAVDDSYTVAEDQVLDVPAPGVLANDTPTPDADWAGYSFRLAKLNEHSLPGEDVTEAGAAFGRVSRAEMVKAFIVSAEYRWRFGRP